MKLFRKFAIGICAIFIFLQIFSSKSLAKGRIITMSDAFSYDVKDMIGDYIDQNGTWADEDGWTGCVEHRGAGYSKKIIAVYETIWDSKTGNIVANSSNAGGNIKGADSQYIRNLAAAMHVDNNINGVRNALRRALNDSKSNLASCSQVQGSKDQNDGDTWDSKEWQAENVELRSKYFNYKTLKADSKYKEGKAVKVKIDGTEYYKIGPFKMTFGSARIHNVEINGTPIMGKGIATYGKSNSNRKKTINELYGSSNYKMYFSDECFYVYVSVSELKSIVGNSSTVKIKFEQNDMAYRKARAFVCDDTGATQTSLWYIHQEQKTKGGTAEFTAKLTDTVDIVVNKVWEDNNAKDRPSSVKVKISAGGAVIKVINGVGRTSITKTITSSGSVTFSDLKRTDDDGNLLEYTVEEEVPNGYTASYTARTLSMREDKSVYTTTITNKKEGEPEEITPGVGELVVTKTGGDMSFRVWEDSPPQWIKNLGGKVYGSGRSVPSNKLTGASYSDKALIDSGKKLGSYVYTYYTVFKTESKYDTHYYTYYVDGTDEDGKPIKIPKTGSYTTPYTYYYYYSNTDSIQCVHVETHDWHGSYKTVNGQYKISGLYPGTYEIYETECDEYYDLEIQSGFSKTGYHGVSNIRLASIASMAENSSETVKLGLPSSTNVYNERTRADLEIEKTYEDGEPIDEIKIAIYGEVNEGEYHYSGWLTTDGSYESVKWNSIGSIFTGSPSDPYITEDGRITITGLPVGTYKIYEVKTKSIEYALEGQGTYEDGKTLLGTVTIARDTYSTVQASYVQKKRPKGDITIDKTGVYVNNQLSSPNVTEKLANVSFILSSKATDLGGWKNGDYVYIRANEKGEDIIDFTDDKSEATIFTTDSEGHVTIPGLYEDLGPYEIEEIENEEQDKYYTDPIVVRGDTTANAPSTASIRNLRSSGDLRIEKVDENYHDLKLSGGKFKLKLVSSEYAEVSNMWLGNIGFDYISDGNTYDYYESKCEEYLVSDVSRAMEFKTDSNGEINIKKIINGTYEVYETKTPRGYDITRQDGYDSSTGMVYRGTVTISTNDNVINYQVVNKKVVNKLDGFVWVDEKDTKANTYNNLYKDSGEKDYLKEGIQVNLVDKNTGKTMASTVTDKNGHYEFTRYSDGSDIIYWDLAHSYVEYIYDNEAPDENGEYGYVVVNPFTGGIEKLEKNSKAQAIEIKNEELFDANLTGTEEPYPGRAVTYTEEQTTGFSEILKQNDEVESRNSGTDLEHKLITSYYDNDRYVIENINLGLIQKSETPYSIEESIAYVRIVKGGYTYTYKYGDDAVTVDNKVQSSIKFQNSSRTFTKAIYPSDIKYNLANGLMGSDKDNETNKYKIYVVYKIEVKNTTTENYIDKYTEQGLYLDEKDNGLTNTYDTSRYTLETEFNKDECTEGDANTQVITSDFARWSDDGNGTASFAIAGSNKKYDRQSGQSGIKPLEIESTYIEFRVKDEVLTNLVGNGQDKNQNETAPTIATINAYHVYTRKDKNWKNKDTYTHETKRKKQSSGALFIKWQLMDTRTISGKVFEDSKVDDLNGTAHKDERVGNGQYDNGEKNLKDVVVSLINAKDNGREDEKEGTVAYLYDENNQIQDETGDWSRAKIIAVTNVDANGNYTFKGVVPGEYYLKFTYGDGKVEFKDAKGNDITSLVTNDGKVETKTQDDTKINSIYYKSTIVTGSAKGAMQSESKGEESNKWWFLEDIGNNKSVATDWMGTYYDKDGNVVKDKNGETYYDMVEVRTTSDWESNYTTGQNKVVIDAKSPVMKIEFEYRGELEFQTQNNEIGNLRTDCTEMNFGIMERPHTDISLDKEIKNIKLTLSNGTVMINGNPSKQNVSSYLAAMNKAYSKIEIASDYLYGSDLTITYKMTATNNSEIDYATDRYYKYGEKSEDDIVTTTVTKIVDYLSYNECDYKEPNQANITRILDEGESYEGEECRNTIYFATGIEDANDKYKKKYILTSSEKKLIPTKADSRDGKKSTAEYIATVSRLIGNSDDDAGINNFSEIIGITNATFLPQYYSTSGSYKAGDLKSTAEGGTSEDDDTGATIVVTPPTGENRSYTMYIVAGISLIVIAGGVILIKKFVL